MVGGGVDDRGAQFGKTAARIPARRMTEAIDRLIDLYAAERSDGETATAFFRRVEVARVRERLLDLEGITAEDALPTDYVDLGEDAQYRMETKEGECAV
jgi:sulfite reductase (NADPH) hemoprotein beta-component